MTERETTGTCNRCGECKDCAAEYFRRVAESEKETTMNKYTQQAGEMVASEMGDGFTAAHCRLADKIAESMVAVEREALERAIALCKAYMYSDNVQKRLEHMLSKSGETTNG